MPEFRILFMSLPEQSIRHQDSTKMNNDIDLNIGEAHIIHTSHTHIQMKVKKEMVCNDYKLDSVAIVRPFQK